MHDNQRVFFHREGDEWVLGAFDGNEIKELGLRVPVVYNTNASGTPEEIYASVSPSGEMVAFMQKPAWPHQITVAPVVGGELQELILWEAGRTPTHTTIENVFTWADDGSAVMFTHSLEACGPEGSGFVRNSLRSVNVDNLEEQVLYSKEIECSGIGVLPRMMMVW